MADMRLQPNPSGTGTFTVQPPNSNTSRTLTLPDNSGNLLTDASPIVLPKGVPMFLARLNANQTISHNTLTLPNYTVEDFDVGGFYDSVNRRFQPTVAGYYHMTHRYVATVTVGRVYYLVGRLIKSGVTVAGQMSVSTASTGTGAEIGVHVSSLVFLNGTTDFVEPVIYHFDYTAASTIIAQSTHFSEFSGFLVSAT